MTGRRSRVKQFFPSNFNPYKEKCNAYKNDEELVGRCTERGEKEVELTKEQKRESRPRSHEKYEKGVDDGEDEIVGTRFNHIGSPGETSNDKVDFVFYKEEDQGFNGVGDGDFPMGGTRIVGDRSEQVTKTLKWAVITGILGEENEYEEGHEEQDVGLVDKVGIGGEEGLEEGGVDHLTTFHDLDTGGVGDPGARGRNTSVNERHGDSSRTEFRLRILI